MKVAYSVASLVLLTACSVENSKHSKADNPYYKVEKIKTIGGAELDKATISGPPTPPKGFSRTIVKPATADKMGTNATSGKVSLSKDKNESFIK